MTVLIASVLLVRVLLGSVLPAKQENRETVLCSVQDEKSHDKMYLIGLKS